MKRSTPQSKNTIFSFLNNQFIYYLIIILLVILLGIYAYKGVFTRYMADDYCYSAQVVGKGFWKTQIDSYPNRMPYNSNRYSLTFMAGITHLLGGPNIAPLIPATMIIGWAIGIYFILSEIRELLKLNILSAILIISSLGIVFSTIFLAPNQFQVLYWVAGALTYLLPLILVTFLVFLFLHFYRKGSSKLIHMFIICLFAFFAGGFSETTAVWQLVIVIIISLLFYLGKFINSTFKKLIASMLIGTILSIILLAISPANALNFVAGNYNQPDILTFITGSLSNSRIFITLSIKTTFLSFLMIGLLGLWTGWESKDAEKFSAKSLLIQILSISIFGFLLIASTMAPSMLARSAYPEGRALIPAMFTLVIIVFLLGWKLSRYLSKINVFADFTNLIIPKIAILLILISFFAFPTVSKNIGDMKLRAEDWDIRHELLLNEASNQTENVIIPAFDSIAEIAEFSDNQGFWINNCGEMYYQVKSIVAIENYLGIPAHPIIP